MAYRPLLDSSPTKFSSAHDTTKYSKLENIPDGPKDYYVQDMLSTQNNLIQEQDQQLDMLSETVGSLKSVSQRINTELDEQQVMLDDLGNELEVTESKIDASMKKMARVLHMSGDSRQWLVIGVLSLILFILLLILIN